MKVVQIGLDEALKIEQMGEEEKYQAFVDKFKPRKTTDDCYTPAAVYDAIAGWVAKEYKLDRSRFLRPFKPGGDYQKEEYPAGCAVVDNPPFSILAEIITWYADRSIPFFLFGPALTIFSARNVDVSYICVGADITYQNGANVITSFVTNLDTCRCRTAPELYRLIEEAKSKGGTKEKHYSYAFPDCVVTAAILNRWSKWGIEYRLAKDQCVRISALDSMKDAGKVIYGGGFLLSEDAAKVHAETERRAILAAEELRYAWAVSDRERRVMRQIGREDSIREDWRGFMGAGDAEE